MGRARVWYHAITDFGEQKRYWWNRSREELVQELLIPILSKQVVLANRKSKKSLFNFGAVSYATIVATRRRLQRPQPGRAPNELKDDAFVTKHNATEEFVNEIRTLSSSPAMRSLLQQALSPPRNQVFVVMKYDDPELDAMYRRVVKPIATRFGYDVIRVDEIPDSGNITVQILEGIGASKIVYVDLSGERPNCYYEAGYAQALGKEMIFALRAGDPVHFDLAGYRLIRWRNEKALAKAFRLRLQALSRQDED
jgi:hypothetical protein